MKKAKDPLLMSIRVAIGGNIIDFGVKNAHIDIEKSRTDLEARFCHL